MKKHICSSILLLLCLLFIDGQGCPLAALANETEVNTDEQSGLIEGAAIFAYHFGLDEVTRLANDGIVIGDKSGRQLISLEKGNILLSPEENVVVDTQEAKVSIESGASIFIMKSDNGVIIYDLCQIKPQQVIVRVGKQKLVMTPGKVLVLTKENTLDFAQLKVNCHAVEYHDAQEINLHNNETKAFVASFSILSALVMIEPLKRLAVSNYKQDKMALERILNGAGAGLMGSLSSPQHYLPRKNNNLDPQFR